MSYIKSTDEIYPVLMEAFEKASCPLTAADLMGHPAVVKTGVERWGNDKVRVSEQISNRLAFMWRRGVLDRFPAPPSHSMAKYAYGLPDKFSALGEIIKYETPLTENKGDLHVVEKDGEVVIELKNFTIVVKPK